MPLAGRVNPGVLCERAENSGIEFVASFENVALRRISHSVGMSTEKSWVSRNGLYSMTIFPFSLSPFSPLSPLFLSLTHFRNLLLATFDSCDTVDKITRQSAFSGYKCSLENPGEKSTT